MSQDQFAPPTDSLDLISSLLVRLMCSIYLISILPYIAFKGQPLWVILKA